jgi:hypothetical protein
MVVQSVNVEGNQVKIEMTIDLSHSMLMSEENIQKSLNEVGCIATKAALKYLDTDGSTIEVGGEKMRTKGELPKAYQTPYGEVVVDRHVYQRAGGGKTYCPLERESSSHQPHCLQNGERRWWELSASMTQQANGNIQFILVQHPNMAKLYFWNV